MSAPIAPVLLRRLAAVLVAALIVGLGLVVAPLGAADADTVVVQPGDLVVNGGAEQPVTVGWTGSLGRATHGSGGYPASIIVNSSGATGATYPGGNALFTGVGAASVASQTIDLSPSAAAIDNGNVDALLSAYVGGYTTQQDNARVSYVFRDAGAATLATVTFGPVMNADRGMVAGFVPFTATQPLPAGTRDVVITITTQRFVAPANDGYVDNVSLILDAPSPVASPDATTTDQGVAVTLTPYSNDAPGAGAAIIEQSVRLLDGGTPVTSLTTAQGIYVVDPLTGDVEFTPAAAFFGTTTPVPYRITDSSGQIDDSTLTIDVTFVATPGLSIVKSASPSEPSDFTLGTVVTYSFVVTNTGNVDIDDLEIAEDAFTGSGTLPVAVCPVTSLAPDAQTTCTTTYTITADDVAAGGVSNTASASGVPDGFGTRFDSGTSTFDIPVAPAPDIALTKSAVIGASDRAGDPLTYGFRVTNTGNVAVSGVTITETAFTGTGGAPTATCPAGPLEPGGFVDCTATYALTQADVDAGSVDNTATASADPASGGSVTSPSSSATVTIARAPAFTFVKSVDRASVTAVGELLTYTFRIVNTGNVTLTDPVIVEDSFSGAGALSTVTCAATTVIPNGTLDCEATYTTVAADLDEATLANGAQAEIDSPTGAVLVSPVSSVSIPISPPATGPGGPPTAPGLADSGVDPRAPTLFGGALFALGLTLAALGAIVVRRRARRHDLG